MLHLDFKNISTYLHRVRCFASENFNSASCLQPQPCKYDLQATTAASSDDPSSAGRGAPDNSISMEINK